MTPVRIVIDISGGCIGWVSAEQPVEIVFVSFDKEDVLEAEADFVSPDGGRCDLRMAGTDMAEPDVVDHYFNQYASNKLQTYTVIVALPDYRASEHAQTYLEFVQATSAKEAGRLGRTAARNAIVTGDAGTEPDGDDVDDIDDYTVVATLLGRHNDLKEDGHG